MKSVFFSKMIMSMLLATAAVFIQPVLAQSDKQTKSDDKTNKSNIRIRVTEETDGNVKNVERSYRMDAMSDKERDEFVQKVLDSLGVDKNKKQAISITVDDDDDNDVIAKKRKKVIIDHRDDREPMAFHWDNDFSYDFDSEKFKSHMKNFEKEFRPRAKVFMKDMENFGDRMGDFWEKELIKPANVHALNAYSNNPDNGMLNLRFSVPEKGDVTISVTDTKGREVGKKEIKDFEGEFVGQIELKKNTKGTLFVTVVQNEDGTVKRVVIP
ncbi:T9SS type A sorting domain-containing protein [Dyadobacter arcticus]|uniref:Secretion system C-terminal sorting domain-containing protein n=1 Tax=Dyadobacter arcticus TaxID=1078754 RepID=A0ABX0URH5_9BACT|nr:T9SS type A sorting domain-containing protein [Dyadobacter arcticus]NIJ55598.1 hypothetical protein [Dyadobacter arcticus]